MSYDGLISIFNNLREIEKDAISIYKEILEDLTNRECRKTVIEYVKAEERHVILIEEALELLRKE